MTLQLPDDFSVGCGPKDFPVGFRPGDVIPYEITIPPILWASRHPPAPAPKSAANQDHAYAAAYQPLTWTPYGVQPTPPIPPRPAEGRTAAPFISPALTDLAKRILDLSSFDAFKMAALLDIPVQTLQAAAWDLFNGK